jgi:hypothetical protein
VVVGKINKLLKMMVFFPEYDHVASALLPSGILNEIS